MNIHSSDIPEVIKNNLKELENAGFDAYLVGGCVRDLLLKKEPKDWDITTNANPEEIQRIYPKTVYENTFGTVAVINESETTENLRVVEITPYRTESAYGDNRRPDTITFAKELKEDLSRRDFTMNALAYSISKGHLIDLYQGQQSIKDRQITTVGNPKERFTEDSLRMLRAVRFSVQCGFSVSHETLIAITECSHLLEHISWERKRDEFSKIIESKEPMVGIGLLQKLGLLKYIIPELEEGIQCEQKGEHIYDVYEHLLHALGHAAEKDFPFHVKLAALLHDIGKPRTRRWDGTKAGGKGKYTFYGHEVVGAKMAQKILERLKYPKKTIEDVVVLVRNHMFFSDTETITLSAVRRVIVNVGRERIWDLMKIRECDRVGMKKKEAPFRLRKYHAMIEEALRSPTSVGMLKIDGKTIMEVTHETPGPKIGMILNALLEETLEKPELNNEMFLVKRALELTKITKEELVKRAQKGEEKRKDVESQALKEIRSKHNV